MLTAVASYIWLYFNSGKNFVDARLGDHEIQFQQYFLLLLYV